MMKITVILVLISILISCNNSFEARKVYSKSSQGDFYELYLISNVTNERKQRYEILHSFIKENMPNLCEADSTYTNYVVDFYRNNRCVRGYMKKYEQLKNVESLMERCERYYSGGFCYERSRSNSKVWILTYPKEIKDTIYCE